MPSPIKPQEPLFTLGDLVHLARLHAKGIFFCSTLLACLAILYALTRPVLYQAEATFKEKAKSQTNGSRNVNLSILTGMTETNEYGAVSLMKSRRLLEEVIRQRHMQFQVERETSYLQRFVQHLKTDWARMGERVAPVLHDPELPLQITAMQYKGEIPIPLTVQLNPDGYVVSLPDGTKATGEYNKPFRQPGFSFALARQTDLAPGSRSLKVTLMPLVPLAERLKNKLKVQLDNQDKSLMKLSYKDPSRREASEFLNALLNAYQNDLRAEHQRLCKEQVAYLQQRQEDAARDLQAMMVDHARVLTDGSGTMELLYQTQQGLLQKLLAIDLELNRLHFAKEGGFVFYDNYSDKAGGGPEVINALLTDMRTLKQQADSIDIAWRNSPESSFETTPFDEQVHHIEELQKCCLEAKALHTALSQKQPLPRLEKLLDNPKFRIAEWQKQLAQRTTSHDLFTRYVAHLIHLLEVEEKITQERLAHQQAGSTAYQGIDLDTGRTLYIEYSHILTDLDADIMHHQHLLEKMQDPHFELSALGTVLTDSESLETIHRATALTQQLQDADNRTERELERVKIELVQQKEFLVNHLQNTLELRQLRKRLYTERTFSLQNSLQELIRQRISLLDTQLSDYLEGRLQNLKREKVAIEQQQLAMQQEMRKLPAKWAAEKLIDQHVEMSKVMMEMITEAVETKSISAHVDLSQSAPLDIAPVPHLAQNSHSLLMGILGAFAGGLLSFFVIVGRSALSGLPATEENLVLRGQNCMGTLSQKSSKLLTDSDLELLRRLVTQIQGAKSVLLDLNQGKDFSSALVDLLQKSGRRTITLSLLFDGSDLDEAGLLPYLEGHIPYPAIFNRRIASGGVTRYGAELIQTDRFKQLFEKLKGEYDIVVLLTRAAPSSAEIAALLPLTDRAVLTLQGETLPQLESTFACDPIFLIY